MRIPVVIAHGSELIPIFIGIVVFANLLGVYTFIRAFRKDKNARAVDGIAAAIVGLFIGFWMFPFGITGLSGLPSSIAIVAPIPLCLFGGLLCARREKMPNQPPEPTSGLAPGRGSP